mmetsp:Transcript_57275/g.170796  ORF Transcript_57275/g.170796 Transcript_57275/m.170796 type:complete len:108 (-) Transcript_57275:445-768(-)
MVRNTNVLLHPESEDPAPWGCFVESVPGILTASINPEMKLENSLPVEHYFIHCSNGKCPRILCCLVKTTPFDGTVTTKNALIATNVMINPDNEQKSSMASSNTGPRR